MSCTFSLLYHHHTLHDVIDTRDASAPFETQVKLGNHKKTPWVQIDLGHQADKNTGYKAEERRETV